MRQIRGRALPFALSAAIFAALLGVFVWRHHHCLYDDAFIYLRYVRNFRAGCGVRWNCDDAPVEGFSSPLHFSLLVVGSLFSSKLVLVSQVIGTLTLLAVGIVAAKAAAETSRDRLIATVAALSVVGVLALDHFVLLNAVIGMDAGISALLVLTTWRLVDRRCPRLAAMAAVGSVLARPEALAFAFALPFFVPRARRWRVVAIIVAGLGAVTFLRYALFRDGVPNTYWAKAGGTTAHARLGAEYLVELASDFPIILLAPLALLERRRRAATGFALVSALVWCAFFLRTGGDTFAYSRLGFPLVPMLTVLAFRGALMLAQRGSRLVRLAHQNAFAALPFALAAARAMYSHDIPEQHGFPNVNAWSVVGRYLEKRFPAKTVATVPIGAIGYTSKLHVIDLVGLTDPVIAKAGRTVPPERLTRGWIGHERHDFEHVAKLLPDVIVMTKYQDHPWQSLEETTAGFYADWLLLRAIKEGRLPYRIADAEIAPGVHWLFFVRQ